jgi:hypothetical protein
MQVTPRTISSSRASLRSAAEKHRLSMAASPRDDADQQANGKQPLKQTFE